MYYGFQVDLLNPGAEPSLYTALNDSLRHSGDYGFQLSTSTGTYLCIIAFNCLPLLELTYVV